jgi:hypothetical protein
MMIVEIAKSVSDGLAGGSVVAAVLLAGWAIGAHRIPQPQPVRVRVGRR